MQARGYTVNFSSERDMMKAVEAIKYDGIVTGFLRWWINDVDMTEMSS